MDELLNADTAIDLVGCSCISLLSDTLKLYFNTLTKGVIGFWFSSYEECLFKKHGVVTGYKAALGEILDTDSSDCPAKFDVTEQIVLARNLAQHGSVPASFLVMHHPDPMKKHPRPLLVSAEVLRDLPFEQGSLCSLTQ